MSTGTFEGELHASGIPGGPCPGTLRIDATSLRFEPRRAGVEPVEFALSDRLSLRLGGAADDMVFFSSADRPGVTMLTRDLAILDERSVQAHPGLAAAAGKARRRFQWLRVSLLVAGAAVLAVILSLIFGAAALVGWAVDKIPPELEIELGRSMIESIKSPQSGWLSDPRIDAAMSDLSEPLRRTLVNRDYPFEIHVVADSTINAYAMPGGQIVLYTGLILEAGSSEELQAVLAHEMAHVTERHSLHAVLRTIGFFSLAQIVFGDAGLVLETLGQGGAELASLSLSRKQELAADRVGREHLVRAGIDPQGMIDFLSRIEGVDQALDFLSTHPATEERIEELRGSGEDGPSRGFEPSSFDLQAFQSLIREVGAIAEDKKNES